MAMTVSTLAGIASTLIFAWSVLPMLAKAHRTRDLASYSLGNLLLANVGNAVHSIYVFSLPAGPIWALHGFYLATSWLLLIWWLRYGRRPQIYANHPRGTVQAFVNDGHNQHVLRDRLSRRPLARGPFCGRHDCVASGTLTGTRPERDFVGRSPLIAAQRVVVGNLD
jgi:uncharacterized protein with PQ loop repeat